MSREEVERAIESIDRGDNAWLDTDEVVQIKVKRPLDKVIPVRLPAEQWEQLRHEARELGIGPTTLLRMWVLEKLREVRRSRQVA